MINILFFADAIGVVFSGPLVILDPTPSWVSLPEGDASEWSPSINQHQCSCLPCIEGVMLRE